MKLFTNISIIGGKIMGEVGKLCFLLVGRISASLTGRFGSSGRSFSPHLFMLSSFHTPIPHFVCLFFLTGMCLLSYKNISWLGTVMELAEFGSCYNQPAVYRHSWLWIKTMPSLRITKVKWKWGVQRFLQGTKYIGIWTPRCWYTREKQI